MKHFLLLSSLMYASQATAEISSLTWPLGEDQCLGTWSYSEMKSCEIDDFNSPLYEGAVTYPSRAKSCGRWAFGHTVAETKTTQVWMDRRTGITTGDEAKNWCYGQEKVTAVASGSTMSYWKDGVYMPDNATQKWAVIDFKIVGSDAVCTLELRNQLAKEDVACGTEEDLSKPIKAFSGYAKKIALDKSCGAETRTLDQGTSLNETLAKPSTVADSALCSTMDESQLLNDSEIKAKAVIINKELLAAMRLDDTQCLRKRQVAVYTQLLTREKASSLPPAQKALLESISRIILNKCPNP